MTTTKELALNDFCAMIRNSWTYARMTDEEQARCIEALQCVEDFNALKGTAAARWNLLHAVYSAFLSGLGYTSSTEWREPK